MAGGPAIMFRPAAVSSQAFPHRGVVAATPASTPREAPPEDSWPDDAEAADSWSDDWLAGPDGTSRTARPRRRVGFRREPTSMRSCGLLETFSAA